MNGVPKIAKLAVEDPDPAVRRKCIYALSSTVRNYQPALNEAIKNLPSDIASSQEVDATDMEAVDTIMDNLRSRIG